MWYVRLVTKAASPTRLSCMPYVIGQHEERVIVLGAHHEDRNECQSPRRKPDERDERLKAPIMDARLAGRGSWEGGVLICSATI